MSGGARGPLSPITEESFVGSPHSAGNGARWNARDGAAPPQETGYITINAEAQAAAVAAAASRKGGGGGDRNGNARARGVVSGQNTYMNAVPFPHPHPQQHYYPPNVHQQPPVVLVQRPRSPPPGTIVARTRAQPWAPYRAQPWSQPYSGVPMTAEQRERAALEQAFPGMRGGSSPDDREFWDVRSKQNGGGHVYLDAVPRPSHYYPPNALFRTPAPHPRGYRDPVPYPERSL